MYMRPCAVVFAAGGKDHSGLDGTSCEDDLGEITKNSDDVSVVGDVAHNGLSC
jgi:hypothetical protein